MKEYNFDGNIINELHEGNGVLTQNNQVNIYDESKSQYEYLNGKKMGKVKYIISMAN